MAGDPARPRCRDGDDYVLNGQKTWASRGAFADWLFGIFRTDPELGAPPRPHLRARAARHARASRCGPIAQLDGETGFAEVFFDDVRVPVANRLGDGGRGLEGRDGDGRLRARPDAAQPGALPGRPRARLVALYRENAGAPPTRCCATRSCAAGWTPRPTRSTPTAPCRGCSRAARSAPRRASTRSSGRRWTCACTRPRSRLLGARAELLPEAPAARGVGDWLDGFLFSLSGPIYAGTNEIQRNVIAERILGLPRD